MTARPPLPPIATEEQRAALAWHNRRAAAKRAGWPDGALEECERLDKEYGWTVSWHPDGYSAIRRGRPRQKARGCGYSWPRVRGATPAELAAAIEAMEEQIAAEDDTRARWSGFMSLTWWCGPWH